MFFVLSIFSSFTAFPYIVDLSTYFPIFVICSVVFSPSISLLIPFHCGLSLLPCVLPPTYFPISSFRPFTFPLSCIAQSIVVILLFYCCISQSSHSIFASHVGHVIWTDILGHQTHCCIIKAITSFIYKPIKLHHNTSSLPSLLLLDCCSKISLIWWLETELAVKQNFWIKKKLFCVLDNEKKSFESTDTMFLKRNMLSGSCSCFLTGILISLSSCIGSVTALGWTLAPRDLGSWFHSRNMETLAWLSPLEPQALESIQYIKLILASALDVVICFSIVSFPLAILRSSVSEISKYCSTVSFDKWMGNRPLGSDPRVLY